MYALQGKFLAWKHCVKIKNFHENIKSKRTHLAKNGPCDYYNFINYWYIYMYGALFFKMAVIEAATTSPE